MNLQAAFKRELKGGEKKKKKIENLREETDFNFWFPRG